MAQFTVTPEHIVAATRPMHGIRAALFDSHAQIATHAGAAGGCTSGSDAVQGAFSAWSDALPQFADAAQQLITSMALAAAYYERADAETAALAALSGA